MHRTCTNTPIKPDRRNWMTRREKQWRRILSTSLLDATVPSDEVSSNSDCENRTVIKIEKNWKRHAGTWLSRLPLTKMEISAGTSSWPSRIFHFTGSFVGHSPSEMLCPPAWKLKKIIKSQTKQVVHRNQRKEVLHLFRWSTHTRKHTPAHIESALGPQMASIHKVWAQRLLLRDAAKTQCRPYRCRSLDCASDESKLIE